MSIDPHIVIQIRIVLDVHEKYREIFPQLIEDTVDFIIERIPEYKTVRDRSPVTVVIDEFQKLENG